MTIMATAPVPAQRRLDSAATEPLPAAGEPCPDWCVGGCIADPEDDDGTRLHDGKITVLRGTGDTVVEEIYLRLSRLDLATDGPGRPVVHLEVGTADLTPDEAVQLAKALVDHANRIRAAGVGEALMYRAETN